VTAAADNAYVEIRLGDSYSVDHVALVSSASVPSVQGGLSRATLSVRPAGTTTYSEVSTWVGNGFNGATFRFDPVDIDAIRLDDLVGDLTATTTRAAINEVFIYTTPDASGCNVE
jgi:hypothetical protein